MFGMVLFGVIPLTAVLAVLFQVVRVTLMSLFVGMILSLSAPKGLFALGWLLEAGVHLLG